MDRKWIIAFVLSIPLTACGSPQPTPEAQAQQNPPAQAQPSPTTAAAAGIDLSGIVTCDLLPETEFAELAGGTVIQTYEGGGPTCTYLIDPPGDEAVATYLAHFESVDVIAPLVSYVKDYEVADWITGLGDQAYVQEAASGGGFDLVVLVRGRFGLTINGPDAEVMKEAARLLLERVAP